MYTSSSVNYQYALGWRMNHTVFTDWASYHTGNIGGTASMWVRGKNGIHCAFVCNSRSYISDFDVAIFDLVGAFFSKLK